MSKERDMVVMENVSFGYGGEDVVKDVSLMIAPGEMCVMTGSNGSGKSTLLKLLLGEMPPRRGEVRLMGQTPDKIKDFRFAGYMPQVSSVAAVAFPVTGLEMVAQSLYREFGFIKIPRRRHKERAREMLDKMGLSAYRDVPFKDLSGGLQQRVMMSRALINSPKLLILDEPTAGVDEQSKREFLTLLGDMNRKEGITVILVTHELEQVSRLITIDALYRMDGGRLTRAAI